MASKQVAYCSLEEAWGETYANLYKKDDSMLTSMPKNDRNFNDSILNDRSLSEKDIGNYYMNKKNEIEKFSSNLPSPVQEPVQELTRDPNRNINIDECSRFFDHYLKCSKCKDKLDKLLGKPSPTSLFNEKTYDIMMILFIGILIIFILDCFFRIAKSF